MSEEREFVEVTVTRGPNGRLLAKPVRFRVPKTTRPGEKAVQEYVVTAFSGKLPSLIPYTFENETLIRLAKYLLRHTTGSRDTLYQYIYGIRAFTNWSGRTPDAIIADCTGPEGAAKTEELKRLLDEFLGDLQAEGLAPGTVSNHIKGVKALFRASGITLTLPFRLSKRVKYRDRSPNPEELQRIIDIAPIREKVIVSVLATSGLREGTLVRLRYRHVKRDLEAGVVPIHIHVESEITKGKYGDYDTFIGEEAAGYLKAYLEMRRTGTRRTPAEHITAESPLIRSNHSNAVKPVTVSRVHRLLNTLYIRAGLIEPSAARRYEVRGHSLRKYFRTQLTALGTINEEYIEYMMGHRISTYHDIQMKGVDWLRSLYAGSGLSIRPRTQATKMDMLKELLRTWGLNPDEILTREAMTRPNATHTDGDELAQRQRDTLTAAFKETVLRDLEKRKSYQTRLGGGSPEEFIIISGHTEVLLSDLVDKLWVFSLIFLPFFMF